MAHTVTVWNPAVLPVRQISGASEPVRAQFLGPVTWGDRRRSIPMLSPQRASGVSLERASGVSLERALMILSQLAPALSQLRRQRSAARRRNRR
jgi:hypothetical protein